MITKKIYLSSFDTGTLDFGFVGENNHIQYQLQCDPVFDSNPGAAVSMTIKSPGGAIYPKTVTVSGNDVIWTVTDSDTAEPGSGQIQITFTDSGEIIKTVIASMSVSPSLIGSASPPDPVADWIEDANAILATLQAAAMVVEEVSGTDPEITAENNHAYICGEVDTISITPPAEGICDVVFISGSTPAALTLPESVELPGWFTGVEADKKYEINIFNGLAAVMTWG